MIVTALATGSGLWASWLWLKASQVEIESSAPEDRSISDVPELHIMNAQTNIWLLDVAMKKSSNLNKKAALWTAISVFLNALSAAGI